MSLEKLVKKCESPLGWARVQEGLKNCFYKIRATDKKMKLQNLLKKFNYTCTYCRRRIGLDEATRDHARGVIT